MHLRSQTQGVPVLAEPSSLSVLFKPRTLQAPRQLTAVGVKIIVVASLFVCDYGLDNFSLDQGVFAKKNRHFKTKFRQFRTLTPPLCSKMTSLKNLYLTMDSLTYSVR